MIREAVRSMVPMGHRNRIARGRVWLRWPTGSLRALPDFLILGAMRAGTSSLYRYLGAHPAVARSLRKEVEYFSRWHHRGEAWYRAHFPLTAFGGRRPRCFEATPYYLCHPHAPRRAQDLLPDARFLVILREPVARAVSHHRHLTRLGIETLPFDEAVAREAERLEGEWERMLANPRYESRAHHLFSYLERGLYARQLRRWLACFPRDRFLILEHEEFFRSPEAGFGEILSFLGLDPWTPPDFRNYSRGTGSSEAASGAPDRPDWGPGVGPELRTRLARHFAPHNRDLEELVGRSLGWT